MFVIIDLGPGRLCSSKVGEAISSLEVFPSRRYPRLFGQPVMNPNLDSSEILIQRTFARSSTSSLVSSLTSLIQPLIRRSKTYSTMAEWKSGRSQSLDPPPFLTWLQCWIRIIAVSETKLSRANKMADTAQRMRSQ